MKLKITLVIIFLLCVAGRSLQLYLKSQQDNKRLVRNEIIGKSIIKYTTDKLGRQMAHSGILQYTNREVKQILPEVKTNLQQMGIKPRLTESYSETGIISAKDIVAPIHDTIFINNTDTTRAKSFYYCDKWYTATGIIADSIKMNITSIDTLIQVVSRGERYNPWLWFLSRRQLVQTIQSRNPANHVSYARFIKISK